MDSTALTVTTEPAGEPVTLAEAKDQVHELTSNHDDYLTTLIKVARQTAERYTRRQFITATYEYRLDKFPDVIEVPRPPTQSITSIQYVDTSGTTQTLASSYYTLDKYSLPARIVEAYGKSWPTVRDHINVVTVTFKAGYGDAASDVPEDLKHAMKLIIDELHRHRGLTSAEVLREVPHARWLLDFFRVQEAT